MKLLDRLFPEGPYRVYWVTKFGGRGMSKGFDTKKEAVIRMKKIKKNSLFGFKDIWVD